MRRKKQCLKVGGGDTGGPTTSNRNEAELTNYYQICSEVIWCDPNVCIHKQILTYKLCNPAYCQPFTVKMIASRVKVLIHK